MKTQRVEMDQDRTRLLRETWYPISPRTRQHDAFFNSRARFISVAAGRRSFKTEGATRKFLRRVLSTEQPNAKFVAAGPTHEQSWDIFWPRFYRLLTPYPNAVQEIQVGRRTIVLATGASIRVTGLDVAQRVEGREALDGILITEFGNVKDGKRAWEEHIDPALGSRGRPGWAIIEGTPEGIANHFCDLHEQWVKSTEAEAFHWRSEGIAEDSWVARCASTYDRRVYEQEVGGHFVSFGGRAYPVFERSRHVRPHAFSPDEDLCLCFDFNVRPSTCAVLQEQRDPSAWPRARQIDEVWLDEGRTVDLCREILARPWAQKDAQHAGLVRAYGDATGRNASTQSPTNDWDQIEKLLGERFGERFSLRVPHANPLVKNRVNALNGLLLNNDGRVGLEIDPRCEKTIRDLERTQANERGEVLKDKSVPWYLTHISDEISYYAHYRQVEESETLAIYELGY